MKTHVLSQTLVSAMGVLLLGAALYLPGLKSLPVTDRDEARYAQASRQMVESGDYVRIRFLDEARNKKPAGIYWLQAVSVRLTGVKDAIWPYRAVSVLGALTSLLLVYTLARRLQPASPLLPVAAFAAAPLLVIVAHAATTDAMLLLATCAAQLCLAEVYLGDANVPRASKILAAIGFWIALAVGILIKGPLTPLIAVLTAGTLCAYDRDVRWLRGLHPAWGVPLMLAIVLPWVIAIQHATQGAFLNEALGHDFGAKLQGGQEAHGAPPGAYLLGASFCFWPLFPLAWRGMGQAWRERRANPKARLLLAWLAPAWLVFELVPTKLPHYVLPLYPVLALLAMSVRPDSGAPYTPAGRLWRITCHIVNAAWWIVAALLIVTPPLLTWLLGGMPGLAAWCCSVLALVTTLWCFMARRSLNIRNGVIGATLFALLYFGLLFGEILPRLDDVWLTRKVAELVASRTHGQPARIVSVGYNEPSLAFALGTQSGLWQDAAGAVAELQKHPGSLALVQDAPAPLPDASSLCGALRVRLARAVTALPKHCQREAFLSAAAQAGLAVREVGSVEGLNYTRTKRVRIILFARSDSAP